MRAAILRGVNEVVRVEEVPPLVATNGEVVVKLSAAALNHRDVWIRKGQYAGLKFPVILGSDGVGTVTSVGSTEDGAWIGQQVVINPSLGWGAQASAQDFQTFNILGLPKDGTFAEEVVVPSANLVVKPPHLSDFEAASVPLAGLTAFRAVSTRAGVVAGERVLVTGAGGGVSTFAVMFAKALGAEVFVTSGSDEKIERAKSLGALGGVNYKSENWDQKLQSEVGGFDVIIDSAVGEGFGKLIDLANPGGRIAIFGATTGNAPEFVARKVFWKQLSILGTTMGSPADFASMLALVELKQLRPIVDKVFQLEFANDALDHMQNSNQFGKIVLQIG